MSSTDFPAPRFGLPRLRAALDAKAISTDVVAVVGIVVLATVIRILTIDNQSIWADEALTAYETHISFGGMLSVVVNYETTPPLYFCLIWCWAKVFGTGAIALRSFSTICGIAMVPAAYVCGREFVSRWTGVLAAAFVAVNPMMVWYSQEARSYMLLALLTAIGFIWLGRAYRDFSRRNLLLVDGAVVSIGDDALLCGLHRRPRSAVAALAMANPAIVGAIAVIAVVQVAMVPFAVADTTHGTAWIHGIPRIDAPLAGGRRMGIRDALSANHRDPGLDRRCDRCCAVVVALYAFGGRPRLAPAGPDSGRDCRVRADRAAAARHGGTRLLPLAQRDPGVPAAGGADRGSVCGAAVTTSWARRLRWCCWRGSRSPRHACRRMTTCSGRSGATWPSALGPAPVPRADHGRRRHHRRSPLKLYLSDVSWVQNQSIPRRIQEVDVIGVRHDFALRRYFGAPAVGLEPVILPLQRGWPVPRFEAPEGARLAARFRVDNWVIGRFVFTRPITVSIAQLIVAGPEFFRATPRSVLVFEQQVGRLEFDGRRCAWRSGGYEVELSVVVPVYGCADCLRALHQRLSASVASITDSYELVLVDDRSRDEGWIVLQRLARGGPPRAGVPPQPELRSGCRDHRGSGAGARGVGGGDGLRSAGSARGDPAAMGGGRRGLRRRADDPAGLEALALQALHEPPVPADHTGARAEPAATAT